MSSARLPIQPRKHRNARLDHCHSKRLFLKQCGHFEGIVNAIFIKMEPSFINAHCVSSLNSHDPHGRGYLFNFRHSRTSIRVLNRWSSTVNHCMFSRVSEPPAQSGIAWSTWCPGQAPRRCPVLGQGFARLKADTSAALRSIRLKTGVFIAHNAINNVVIFINFANKTLPCMTSKQRFLSSKALRL